MKPTDAEILAMDNATWIDWLPEDAEPISALRWDAERQVWVGPEIRMTRQAYEDIRVLL